MHTIILLVAGIVLGVILHKLHSVFWSTGVTPSPEPDGLAMHDMVARAPGALGVEAVFDELDGGRETWLQTYGGQAVDLLQPKVGQVDIFDTALSVSRIPRFLGRTEVPYFVAQHLVLTALLLWKRIRVPAVALHGLAHDLHEARIGDLPTPLTWALGPEVDRRVKALKKRHDAVIFDVIGLEPTNVPDSHALVKAADADMLIWERDNFLGPSPRPWVLDGKTKQLTHEDFGLEEDSPLLQPLPSAHAMLALLYLLEKWAGVAAGALERLYEDFPPCSLPSSECSSCSLRQRLLADLRVAAK